MGVSRKVSKIAAGIAAFSLIALLLVIANGLVGNPLSAGVLTWQARRYVAETYPGQGLQVDWAQYSFKTGSYQCAVRSPTSPDTSFSVFRRGGEIQDNHETYVEGRFNTWARLDKEADAYLDDLVAREFPHRTRLVLGQLSEETGSLELDMALDIKNPPGELSLTVWCGAEDPSYEELARRLVELASICDREGLPMAQYSLSLEALYVEEEGGGLIPSDFDRTVYLFDFPASEVDGGDIPALARRLEEFQSAREQETDKEQKLEQSP